MTVEDRLRDALIARADALAGPDADQHPADVVVPLSARRSGWMVVGAVAAVAALVLGAVAMIDRPERPQRVAADRDSLPGDQALVYVFEKDNQIWGVTRSGGERQLTSGPSAFDPIISPNGRTLLYTVENRDAPYDDVVALDLGAPGTGPSRPITSSGVTAIAANGDVASAIHVDDSAQEVTIDILDHARGFARQTTSSLGASDAPGCDLDCVIAVHSLGWDADSRRLLAVTGGPTFQQQEASLRALYGHQLWSVDTVTGRTNRLTLKGGRGGWLVGRAIAPGVFPAIARDRGLFGTLIVDGQAETATFIESPQPRRPGEGATDRLDLTTAVSVEALVIGGSPGARTNVPAGYLIADARNLWFLSADGEERLIRSGPTRASATAAAGGFFGAS